jgi:hypothetical protein
VLTRLGTSGNRIIRIDTGAAVRLRGVNRSGLEYSEPGTNGFLESAGITREEIEEMCGEWQANIIRLPFNQDWALHGRGGWPAEAYWDAIEHAAVWAASCGAYTLLTLQWLQADTPYGPNRQFIAPVPDWNSVKLWRRLGRRFRNHPEILFDLYTEPHDVSAADWNLWAARLAGAVREENAETLLVVSGVDWGYNLRAVEVEMPRVVYSSHVYPSRGLEWERAFGRRAAKDPVILGEWGGRDGDLEWGRRLLAYADQLGLGWCAWGWSDQPRLREAGRATPFGALVRDALA